MLMEQPSSSNTLSRDIKDVLHTASCCGTNAFIKHVTDIEIFSKESKLVSIRIPPLKGLYILVFDYLFPCDDHDPRVWCDIVFF